MLERLRKLILERTGQPLADDPVIAKTICEVIEEQIDTRVRPLEERVAELERRIAP